MSKFDGFFKDWSINDYTASHKDGRKLWVANGFLFFRSESHKKASMRGFNLRERYQLWKELKAEIRRRDLAKD
jgi:hypothetical protein